MEIGRSAQAQDRLESVALRPIAASEPIAVSELTPAVELTPAPNPSHRLQRSTPAATTVVVPQIIDALNLLQPRDTLTPASKETSPPRPRSNQRVVALAVAGLALLVGLPLLMLRPWVRSLESVVGHGRGASGVTAQMPATAIPPEPVVLPVVTPMGSSSLVPSKFQEPPPAPSKSGETRKRANSKPAARTSMPPNTLEVKPSTHWTPSVKVPVVRMPVVKAPPSRKQDSPASPKPAVMRAPLLQD